MNWKLPSFDYDFLFLCLTAIAIAAMVTVAVFAVAIVFGWNYPADCVYRQLTSDDGAWADMLYITLRLFKLTWSIISSMVIVACWMLVFCELPIVKHGYEYAVWGIDNWRWNDPWSSALFVY